MCGQVPHDGATCQREHITLWESQRPALRGAESHSRFQFTLNLPSRKGSERFSVGPTQEPPHLMQPCAKPHTNASTHAPSDSTSCHAHFAGTDTQVPRTDTLPTAQEAGALSTRVHIGTLLQDNPRCPSLYYEMDTETTAPPHFLRRHLSIYPGQAACRICSISACFVACDHILPTLGSGRKRKFFLSDPRSTSGFECWSPDSPSEWIPRRQRHCPGGKTAERIGGH